MTMTTGDVWVDALQIPRSRLLAGDSAVSTSGGEDGPDPESAAISVVAAATGTGRVILVAHQSLRRIEIWRTADSVVFHSYATDADRPMPTLTVPIDEALPVLGSVLSAGTMSSTAEMVPADRDFVNASAIVAAVTEGADGDEALRATIVFTMNPDRAAVRLDTAEGALWGVGDPAQPFTLRPGEDSSMWAALLQILA